MDTKWKNKKKILSFLIFFIGISMTLGSLWDLMKHKPAGVKLWQADKLLEDDYQQTGRFRSYIANRLENFLIMAVGGSGLGGIWGYNNGKYYREGYDDYDYGSYDYDIFEDFGGVYYSFGIGTPLPQEQGTDSSENSSDLFVPLWMVNDYLFNLETLLNDYLDTMEDLEAEDLKDADSYTVEAYLRTLADCQTAVYDYLNVLINDLGSLSPSDKSKIMPLTEQQKKELAEKYHNAIKEDKNLLYTIAYEGQVLYSNTDFLPADGQLSAPEGYNFILYFDGEKVRILKDGKEVNIYGDGYYRESNDWYLPGYSNFQLEDNAKKATVYIAAAKEPVLYRKGSYSSGGSTQYDNTLYWLYTNLQTGRRQLLTDFLHLGIGVVLLLLAFLTRKSRREAAEGIARIQAKIWIEGKIALFLTVLYFLYRMCSAYVTDGCGYDLWQELYYAYDYEHNAETISILMWELVNGLPTIFWLLLFWSLWLLWNDCRHNKKREKNSLTAKLCKTFSAKNLKQSFSRKIMRRNRILFAASLFYGALMLGSIVFLGLTKHFRPPVFLLVLMLPGTACFLTLQFIAGSRNAENARDIEALSRRISEIRNGNYTQNPAENHSNDQSAPCFAGHDLETVMAQLEDIRHGMAKAVDEQMSSQRMKVELIANVSHDIKTPLTSIISYVEFLKQEEALPEHVKDYIRILDEKSQRLKNMVQDVFAVSKAASGQLPMQMEALDFGKLLRQTMADMEEEIDGSAVTFRTEIPETPVMIMADGQRLYRVFQNLFQNCLKYSLSGSRVYVTLKTDGTIAVASVKNTSRQELEKGKDFAERFARGDQSRTDGGSGLGLSIAQSFTEACGGTFTWGTDADLFVVKVSFRSL